MSVAKIENAKMVEKKKVWWGRDNDSKQNKNPISEMRVTEVPANVTQETRKTKLLSRVKEETRNKEQLPPSPTGRFIIHPLNLKWKPVGILGLTIFDNELQR
jgi:hypothetical protein